MRKHLMFIAFLIACICGYQPVKGQYYFYDDHYYDSQVIWELAASAGGMNCLTDLGGKGTANKHAGDVNWKTTRLCGSIHGAILLQNLLGARLELSFGNINASDSVLKHDPSGAYGRYLRNLSFRSQIKEALLVVEFHPLSLTADPPWVSPYLFAGVGFFSFRPEAIRNNKVVNLQTLHTEGQGFAEYPGREMYKLTQWNLPVGCGIKYEISATSALRLEMMYRKLWTDYLDDVSKTYVDPALFSKYISHPMANLATGMADRALKSDPTFSTDPGQIRGDDKNNDAYFSFTMKLVLTLGRKPR